MASSRRGLQRRLQTSKTTILHLFAAPVCASPSNEWLKRPLQLRPRPLFMSKMPSLKASRAVVVSRRHPPPPRRPFVINQGRSERPLQARRRKKTPLDPPNFHLRGVPRSARSGPSARRPPRSSASDTPMTTEAGRTLATELIPMTRTPAELPSRSGCLTCLPTSRLVVRPPSSAGYRMDERFVSMTLKPLWPKYYRTTSVRAKSRPSNGSSMCMGFGVSSLVVMPGPTITSAS